MVAGRSGGRRRTSRGSGPAARERDPPSAQRTQPPNLECSFCGASQQDVDRDPVDEDVEKHVCCFQTAAKRSVEISEKLGLRYSAAVSDLRSQQAEIEALNEGIQSDRQQLISDRVSLQQRENTVDVEHQSRLQDLQERQKSLLQREQVLEEKMNNLYTKETTVVELEKSINSRSLSLTEKDASLETNIARREEDLIARENRIDSLLKAAEETDIDTVELQSTLVKKETSFIELESATIKQLNGKEHVLEKREAAVAKLNGELQMQRNEIDMLRQDVQKREEQFEQWERLSKYDIIKSQESLSEKEKQLSSELDKYEEKGMELDNHFSEYEKRETDFKMLEANRLQEIERRSAEAMERANTLRHYETTLSTKEKEVLSLSNDVQRREEAFRVEHSIWKIEMERRERIVSEKEENLARKQESISEMQEAILAAEKEIQNRRRLILTEEKESKIKLESNKIKDDEFKLNLAKTEERLALQKEKLDKWENELEKRERYIYDMHMKADHDLQSRELEVRKLESKWDAMEGEYALKQENLSMRNADIARREEDFQKRERTEYQGLANRLQDVEGLEKHVAQFEQDLSKRQSVVVEEEKKLHRKTYELDEVERKLISDSERREAELRKRELDVSNQEINLNAKEDDLELFRKDILARTEAYNESIEIKTKKFTRRKSDLYVQEAAVVDRRVNVKEREEKFANLQLEIKERLKNIDAREARLATLLDREKQLAEYEQLVEMKDREISNWDNQLHNLESSLRSREIAKDAQMKELDERESRIAGKEKLSRSKIDRQRIYESAYEEEMKQTRIEISQREKNVFAMEEDISNREEGLVSKSYEVEQKMEILESLDLRLQKLETVLSEKDKYLKEMTRKLAKYEESHIQRQKVASAELETREKAVAASEVLMSRRQLQIQKMELKIHEETKILESNRTEIQLLRQKLHMRDRRIHELDERIRQIYADVGKCCNMNSQAINLVQRRKISEDIIGSEPMSVAGDGIGLTKHLDQSSYISSTHNFYVSSRLDESTMLTSIEDTQPQSARAEEPIAEERGGWYGHMRNILFGWNSTASRQRKPRRDVDSLSTARPVHFDASYLEVAREPQIARLERGIYPAGGSRKRNSSPLASGEKDADPENAPVGKQMRIDPNLSTLANPSI